MTSTQPSKRVEILYHVDEGFGHIDEDDPTVEYIVRVWTGKRYRMIASYCVDMMTDGRAHSEARKMATAIAAQLGCEVSDR